MKNKKYKVVLVNGSMGENDILEVNDVVGKSKKEVSYKVFDNRIREVVESYLESYKEDGCKEFFEDYISGGFEFEGIEEWKDNKVSVGCGEENFYMIIEEGEKIYNCIDELNGDDISKNVWNKWIEYLDREEKV